MPYPQLRRPRRDLAGALGARGLPVTVFYDADGKQAYVHQGPYRDEAKLSEDIERYASAVMIEVREARDDAERAAAMAIRHTVFVEEQDVPGRARGRRARRRRGAPRRPPRRAVVGDLPPARSRRAPSSSAASRSTPSARRQGIAGLLRRRPPTSWARAHGADRIVLSAQTYAAGLYARRRLHRGRQALSRGRDRARGHGEATLAEIRVDPITGDRAIVAGERAGRPNAAYGPARGADRPRARSRSRPGHEEQTPPEVCGAAPRRRRAGHARLARARVPNLYPALAPDAPDPEPSAAPDLFTALPAAGRARGDRQRARRRSRRSPISPPEQVAAAMERVARADARARGRRATCTSSSTSAARPAPPCRTPTRSSTRCDFVPAGRRARARALRRLRDADDGRQPPRRPRAGGGPPAATASSRSTTRRSCIAPYASRLPYQLMLAPRRARRALRGRRAARRRAAARRAAAPRAPLRRQPAAEPLGAHRAARRRALLLADRRRAAPHAPRRARARHRRAPQHRRAGAGRRRAARRSRRCRPRAASRSRRPRCRSRRARPPCRRRRSSARRGGFRPGVPVSFGTTPVMDISPWTSSSCATSSPRSRNHGSS